MGIVVWKESCAFSNWKTAKRESGALARTNTFCLSESIFSAQRSSLLLLTRKEEQQSWVSVAFSCSFAPYFGSRFANLAFELEHARARTMGISLFALEFNACCAHSGIVIQEPVS